MERKPFLPQNLPGQVGDVYFGKVRQMYDLGDLMVAITTDQISAFDHVMPFEIRGKGAILNMIACRMMESVKHSVPTVPTCLISMPHSQVAIFEKTTPFKVEFVFREYLEGSMWRDYKNGKRQFWGYMLPQGMKYQQKLPQVMFTPTTKEDIGNHDQYINDIGIVENGLMTLSELDEVKEKGFKLFEAGQMIAKNNGLILVDTKYEFGKTKDGRILLIDEVHTPDSSRYYYLDGYGKNFAKGKLQKQLSKEFFRDMLVEKGFSGEEGQTIPEFSDSEIFKVEQNYLEIYQQITGEKNYQSDHESNPQKIYDLIVKFIPSARNKVSKPVVVIAMGSESDLGVMSGAFDVLNQARISFTVDIVSAHRTPEDLPRFVKNAEHSDSQVKVIIAGAGGAAHLPGMIAAYTILPVIGVPVKSSNSIGGIDSLYSIVQMPPRVPTLTMGIDGAENAGISAIEIIGSQDPEIKKFLRNYKAESVQKVHEMRKNIAKFLPSLFD